MLHPLCCHDSVPQDVLPAERTVDGPMMNSLVLGVMGQRLGLLQLAARAAADSSEEAFSSCRRRGGGGHACFSLCLVWSTPPSRPFSSLASIITTLRCFQNSWKSRYLYITLNRPVSLCLLTICHMTTWMWKWSVVVMTSCSVFLVFWSSQLTDLC